MMSVLALSGNPLIPDDHGVHLALSCHVLARYVCENQICVPVVKRCQIGLEVKGERQDKVIIRLATMRDIREKIMNRNN